MQGIICLLEGTLTVVLCACKCSSRSCLHHKDCVACQKEPLPLAYGAVSEHRQVEAHLNPAQAALLKGLQLVVSWYVGSLVQVWAARRSEH